MHLHPFLRNLNMNIATYMLASLGSNSLQKLSIKLDEKIHHITNAINMYRAIYDHDMQYVWFGEFCRALNAKSATDFYQNVLGGSGNLVETPLGYDSTSHSAFFILTMHYNFQIDEVDLTKQSTFETIYCYSKDGVLHLPHNIVDGKTSGVDSIHSTIYHKISDKYKDMRTASRADGSFDEELFTEFVTITRKEGDEARTFINQQEDNTEFEYMGHKFIKNIPVDDPEIIHSLLLAGHHFDD